jgi:hypothetical protein
MATWTVFVSIWGNEIEFQAEFPDDYTDQQVWEAIYEDMFTELTKED